MGEDERLRESLRTGEVVGSGYALEPPRQSYSGIIGARLAARAGSSVEFMDYRQYQPGDDLRI